MGLLSPLPALGRRFHWVFSIGEPAGPLRYDGPGPTLKLSLLALDYDGTIASDGLFDAGVRAEIAGARERGVLVVLVTGRILEDLRRLLVELELFDAIVAENGAVLHLPVSGRTTPLGAPPPAVFLEELRRRGVPVLVGDCVVEAEGRHAQDVLAVVRELELPLVLHFNRSRMMVLPQSISKATGLREACRTLRASLHGALAIGDAENDHEMLAACEVGVAAGWGSAALQAVADHVLPGAGPAAVGPWLRELIDQGELPLPAAVRRRLHLGITSAGQPLSLALRGRNVLVAGSPRSGKSWVAGLLAEQLVLLRYCVCIVDPEGDYGALESLPGVIVLVASAQPPPMADVERTLRYPDVSLVIDLSRLDHATKLAYVPRLLSALRALKDATGLPHRIVLDEAHQFLRDSTVERLGARQGGFTLVTYRVSQIDPELLATAGAVLVSGESDAKEARALHRLYATQRDEAGWIATLAELEMGEAVLLPGAEESGDELVRFRLARRITPHVRHRRKYLESRVAPQHAFHFGTGQRAFCLQELLEALTRVDDATLGAHLERGDFSRWVADVLTDEVLAGELRAVEQSWSRDGAPRVRNELARSIRARYSSESIDPAR